MISVQENIKKDLHELCTGDRHVGSQRNQRATAYVAERLGSMGLSVSKQEFACIDWEYGDISLKVGQENLQAVIGPYSLPCHLSSRFETVSTVEELEDMDLTGKIAVLCGELCKEQLMAKNFEFYNPDHHKHIIGLLEQKNPLAIVAITGRNPELAGAVYPFPLIEDGDFNIPVACVTLEEGEKLLHNVGQEMTIDMESTRIPSIGYNVVGVKRGQVTERIVLCAHIDTKKGTPGAIDNGGGVALLLALADLMKDYKGKYALEFFINNGEDYYAYSGGMRYLAENRGCMEQIVMAINSDGVGSKGSRTTYCTFNASTEMDQAVKTVFQDENKFTATIPWYQSDHMLFAMNQRPAVALTTEDMGYIWSNIAHTSLDTIDMVDPDILFHTALALQDLIYELNRTL
jgi:aminopeptidase YwaD